MSPGPVRAIGQSPGCSLRRKDSETVRGFSGFSQDFPKIQVKAYRSKFSQTLNYVKMSNFIKNSLLLNPPPFSFPLPLPLQCPAGFRRRRRSAAPTINRCRLLTARRVGWRQAWRWPEQAGQASSSSKRRLETGQVFVAVLSPETAPKIRAFWGVGSGCPASPGLGFQLARWRVVGAGRNQIKWGHCFPLVTGGPWASTWRSGVTCDVRLVGRGSWHPPELDF